MSYVLKRRRHLQLSLSSNWTVLLGEDLWLVFKYICVCANIAVWLRRLFPNHVVPSANEGWLQHTLSCAALCHVAYAIPGRYNRKCSQREALPVDMHVFFLLWHSVPPSALSGCHLVLCRFIRGDQSVVGTNMAPHPGCHGATLLQSDHCVGLCGLAPPRMESVVTPRHTAANGQLVWTKGICLI